MLTVAECLIEKVRQTKQRAPHEFGLAALSAARQQRIVTGSRRARAGAGRCGADLVVQATPVSAQVRVPYILRDIIE
jgi:hypothetical protein